ncbi:MAG: RluA family pseudouridine synthase [Actinomycetota bacterium]|nr:RluA family pseudouridine synthase [Actinomycetota bacterium]
MELRSAPENAGTRIDAFLADPLGSRSRAQRLIEVGAVTVDGRVVPKSAKLAGGETIAVDESLDPVEEPADVGEGEPAEFGVAWEDEHLLVVDKPAGVVVHPARGHHSGTLAQALAGRAVGGEQGWRAGIVHRLDRDTSGLLVVAKSERVHRALKEQLAAREITREYLALVEGRPPARSGTIDAPIGRDRRVRTRNSTDTDEPREARTHFELAEALPRHTLLRVRLETGRTHQIRVHLQAIGFPVAGDPEYGTAGELGLERQFLHAQRLSFTHPVNGEPVVATSPLPTDLVAALERARG